MRFWQMLAAGSLALAGCGGDDGGDSASGAGGSAGAAGSAGSATAETRPLGAASYDVESSPVGALCGSKFADLGIGLVDGASYTPAVDGVNSAIVTCTVAPSSTSNFVLDAKIQTFNDRFEVRGVIDTLKESSEVDVSANNKKSDKTYSSVSTPRCTLVTTPTATEPSLGVKAGEVWGRFYCPEVVLDGNASNEPRCALSGPAYLVFKNCTTTL